MGTRFRRSEVTVERVLTAAARRVLDIPHGLAWQAKWGLSRVNKRQLDALRGRHQGQRCVVIANGPSLAAMDLSTLEDEITISMNRAYLLYGNRLPMPRYFACINELVLEQFRDDIAALPMLKFLNWDRRALFRPDDNVVFIRTGLRLRDRFQPDLTRTISSGGTVTFAALQVAYHMGFDEAIIIGLDHSFTDKGTPNRTEVRTADTDINHCHPDYFPKGTSWQLPDLRRSETAYALARRAFEERGGRIIDATVGGECQVFEKGDLSELLGQR